MHRTAGESSGLRARKKLLDRSEWYKSKKKVREEQQDNKVHNERSGPNRRPFIKPKPISLQSDKNLQTGGHQVQQLKTRSIMFVEQTKGSKLAKALREVLSRLEPMLGFKVKIVEKSGTSLRKLMPNTNPKDKDSHILNHWLVHFGAEGVTMTVVQYHTL